MNNTQKGKHSNRKISKGYEEATLQKEKLKLKKYPTKQQ